MYYLLTTGRIITERDLRSAYEICNGIVPGVHPGHYENWIHEIYGIVRSIPAEEITVEQLVEHNCLVEAMRVYRAQNKCTLYEARMVIERMREEM